MIKAHCNLVWSFGRVAAAGALMTPIGIAAATEGSSFHDQFEQLDEARWYVSHGWTNGDHQNCLWSKRQVVADGALHLSFAEAPDEVEGATTQRDYVCAEVQTHQRFSYGTYEARLKAVDSSGYNSAFFTYIGPVHDQPHDEIDVEVLGRNADRVEFNQFVDGRSAGGTLVEVPGGTASKFVTYAFIWEPERLRYFVDGELVHEVLDPAVIPDQPMKIFSSLWAGETNPGWMGPFDPPDGPLTMEVDWIAYTAIGEPCQFPESVACEAR